MSSSLLFSSIICTMLYHIDSTFTQLMPDIYSCDPFLWNASGSFSSCTQMLVLGIYLLGTKWNSGGGSVLSKGGTWRVWREKGCSVAVVGQVIVTDSCGHSCNGRRVRSRGAACGSGLSLSQHGESSGILLVQEASWELDKVVRVEKQSHWLLTRLISPFLFWYRWLLSWKTNFSQRISI